MTAPEYTAATGCLSAPADALRNSLAACDAFQDWINAADATEAKLRIYLQGIPLPGGDDESYSIEQLETIFPCALIYLTSFEAGTDATGDGFEWGTDSGTLELILIKLIPPQENDPGELERELLNTGGAILDALKDLAGIGGNFAMTRFTTPGIYRVTDEQMAAGEIPSARLAITITWGNGQ
jgi:hypothetical protein